MQTKPDIPDAGIPDSSELVKNTNYNAKIAEIGLVV